MNGRELMNQLQSRIAVLEAENTSLKAKVALVQTEVAAVVQSLPERAQ